MHADDQTQSPAERRRRRVRTQILDAAEKVFQEEGESGLSIRRLAEEIDYSPAAIYRYFGSKDELVDEMKEAFFERILVLIEESRQSPEPFSVKARKCIGGYVRTAIEKPYHYAAAFSGFAADGAPMDIGNPDLDRGPAAEPCSNKEKAFAFLVDMVRSGQEIGHLRRELDPSHAAFCIWAACHGMAMIMIHTQSLPALETGAPQANLDAMIDGHADIFIRGLEATVDPIHPRAATAGVAFNVTDGPSSHLSPQDPARHD